jgi:hypothetical protein
MVRESMVFDDDEEEDVVGILGNTADEKDDVVLADEDGRLVALVSLINDAKKPPIDDNDGNIPLPLLGADDGAAAPVPLLPLFADDCDELTLTCCDDDVVVVAAMDVDRIRTAGANNDGIDVVDDVLAVVVDVG